MINFDAALSERSLECQFRAVLRTSTRSRAATQQRMRSSLRRRRCRARRGSCERPSPRLVSSFSSLTGATSLCSGAGRSRSKVAVSLSRGAKMHPTFGVRCMASCLLFVLADATGAAAQTCGSALVCNQQIYAYAFSNNYSGADGVYGYSVSGSGSHGASYSSNGVRGESYSGNGVQGESSSNGVSGVYGQNNACTGYGVAGRNSTSCASYGAAIYGDALNGSGAWAGYFHGSVVITGTMTANDKDFVIDHPVDPANKYLFHHSVESDEMKTVYDGIATLDASGEATVSLPSWFEALNSDFRYQLTCIGSPSSVYIAEEISKGQFKIAGGKPGIRVSWQVTGVRHDPYARAYRTPVEAEKEFANRGKYLAPELFGADPETGRALMSVGTLRPKMRQ